MYTRKEIPFDPVTLSFRDKELEADFRDDFFTRNLSHFRQDLLLGCFLYAVYGILDFWIIPEIRIATWYIRFALVCPLLLGVFLFTFSRLSRRFLEPALILACFAAGAGIIAMIVMASPPGSHLYYAGLLLCLLFYFRLRFLTASILSWSIFVLYETAVLMDARTQAPILISNTFIFLSFIIAGMFLCYSMERYKRSDFLLRRTIQRKNDEILSTNRELEREVRERKQAEEENRRLQEQLFQSQKMEAVGQLAGGIAHEFNNILAAVIGYAGFLRMKMRKDDPLLSYVEKITFSGQRAARLTQDLLSFSRKQRVHPQLVKLNDIMSSVKPLLSMMIGKNVELSVSCRDTPITILADCGLLEQVLVNLASNARDAMPEGGLLTIYGDVVEMTDEFTHSHGTARAGRYARITVADRGHGMDEATRTRIFEPFFTTKEVGRGTGLGLAMVYGIIKQHNGFLDVTSMPGEGTTFRIYLPLAGQSLVPFPEETPEAAASATWQ
jgi:signal transduction histidine kinase